LESGYQRQLEVHQDEGGQRHRSILGRNRLRQVLHRECAVGYTVDDIRKLGLAKRRLEQQDRVLLILHHEYGRSVRHPVESQDRRSIERKILPCQEDSPKKVGTQSWDLNGEVSAREELIRLSKATTANRTTLPADHGAVFIAGVTPLIRRHL